MPSDFTFDRKTGEIRIANKQLQAKIKARIAARQPVWVNLPDHGLVASSHQQGTTNPGCLYTNNCPGGVAPNILAGPCGPWPPPLLRKCSKIE